LFPYSTCMSPCLCLSACLYKKVRDIHTKHTHVDKQTSNQTDSGLFVCLSISLCLSTLCGSVCLSVCMPACLSPLPVCRLVLFCIPVYRNRYRRIDGTSIIYTIRQPRTSWSLHSPSCPSPHPPHDTSPHPKDHLLGSHALTDTHTRRPTGQVVQ